MPRHKTRRYRRAKSKRKQKRARRTRNRHHKGGGSSSDAKVFHFYNRFHLGDNILNLKFFFNISDIMKQNGITIRYYYDDSYKNNKREELERFVNKDTLSLCSMRDKPEGAIELWMGNPIDGYDYLILDTFYDAFYKNILKQIGLEGHNISTSLYQPEPYLQDIYNNLDDKYKNLDILVINAEPQSGQFQYNKKSFDDMCIYLHKKYNIATTSPVNDDIKCTMKDKLMLKDIGAISTHVNYIVGVHSGPVTACFNADTNNNVKKWILFVSNKTVHANPKFHILNNAHDVSKIEEFLK